MAVRMDMAMVLAVVVDHPESTPVMNDCRRCLDETMPESAKSVTVGVMSLDCCFPLPLWEEEQGEGEHIEEVTMKIEQTTMLDYDEVDTDFQMKLPVLFQRLQRAAVHHSEQVGLGSVAMVAAGAVWVLNRMRVDIFRMPVYREEITLMTWHKGSAGFRAGRDFLVFCGKQKVAAATSLWLYYDLNRKRIAKIPKRISEPYTTEAEDALAADAIDFAVDKTFVPAQTIAITTREGDYDPNGHVNNTVYLEYLDTLVKRSGIGDAKVGQVGIQYLKEIGRDVHTLQAGVATAENTVKFRFFDPTAVYAAGFVTAGELG